jgi:Co/Zn/Cd efflux system component
VKVVPFAVAIVAAAGLFVVGVLPFDALVVIALASLIGLTATSYLSEAAAEKRRTDAKIAEVVRNIRDQAEVMRLTVKDMTQDENVNVAVEICSSHFLDCAGDIERIVLSRAVTGR